MLYRQAGLLFLTGLLASLRAAAQEPPVKPQPAPTAIYDGVIKITAPAEWSLKRSWDVSSPGTTNRDLPFYRADLLAAAYVGGRRQLPFPPRALEKDRADEALSVLIFYWPGEARRFYPALGGLTTSEPEPGTVVSGESYKPGQQTYLGEGMLGAAKVTLVEWLTTGPLDTRAVKGLLLPADYLGRRLQCILAMGQFEGGNSGYIAAACRFAGAEHGVEWIKPLLAGVEPLAPSDVEAGAKADKVRNLVMDAVDKITMWKEYSEAAGMVDEALKLSPDDENVLSLRAVLLAQGNHLPEAEKLLSRVIAIDPDHEYARYQLGVVLCQEGKQKEAAVQFARVERMTLFHPPLGCNRAAP